MFFSPFWEAVVLITAALVFNISPSFSWQLMWICQIKSWLFCMGSLETSGNSLLLHMFGDQSACYISCMDIRLLCDHNSWWTIRPVAMALWSATPCTKLAVIIIIFLWYLVLQIRVVCHVCCREYNVGQLSVRYLLATDDII